MVVWSRKEGAAFWTFLSSPGCVHYCAVRCDGGSEALFFFLISHQSFPSLKVGDDFLEHTSVASHALAAFKVVFFF